MAKKPSPTFDGGSIPPPPPGYTMVDASNIPPPPPGYTMQGEGTPAPPQEEPGMLSKIWGGLNKGLVSGDSMLNFAGKLGMSPADMNPGESTADYVKRQANAPADPEHPYLNAAKVGLAGAVKDTYDTASSFTSPLSIALMGAGALGKAPGAIGKAVRAAMPVVGGLFAGQGTKNAVEGGVDIAQNGLTRENTQQLLYGGAGVASGTAGMVAPLQSAHAPLSAAPGRFAEGVRSRLVPGTPAELLTRATKPNVGLPDYEDSLNRSMPALAAKNPKSLLGLADAADSIARDSWDQYQNLKAPFRRPQGAGPFNPAQVDARPVADAQMSSIPATDLFEKPNQQTVVQRGSHQLTQGNPGIFQKTADVADLYRTDMPVDQADAIVRDTNAKLRAQYNKSAGDRAAAMSNPETSRLFSVNNTLRDQLYGTIDKGTGINPRPIMQQYGDATDIGDTAGRRNTVWSRRQPFGIEQVATKGPISLGTGLGLKYLNDNNNLVRFAFDRYRAPQYSTRDLLYGPALSAVTGQRSR